MTVLRIDENRNEIRYFEKECSKDVQLRPGSFETPNVSGQRENSEGVDENDSNTIIRHASPIVPMSLVINAGVVKADHPRELVSSAISDGDAVSAQVNENVRAEEISEQDSDISATEESDDALIWDHAWDEEWEREEVPSVKNENDDQPLVNVAEESNNEAAENDGNPPREIQILAPPVQNPRAAALPRRRRGTRPAHQRRSPHIVQKKYFVGPQIGQYRVFFPHFE